MLRPHCLPSTICCCASLTCLTLSVQINANHGGGYSYRLCKLAGSRLDLTEECFEQNPLNFVGDTQWIERVGDATRRVEIRATRTKNGTFPAGSQWSRNPIPACNGYDGGSGPEGCKLPAQFEPPVDADGEKVYGFRALPWNVVDKVWVPPALAEGDYVLQWRCNGQTGSNGWPQPLRATTALPMLNRSHPCAPAHR